MISKIDDFPDDELPAVNEPNFNYRQCELFTAPKKDSKKCRTCGIEKGLEVFLNPYTGKYFRDCRGCRLWKGRERARKPETKKNRIRYRQAEKRSDAKRYSDPIYKLEQTLQRWGGRGRLDWTCKVLEYNSAILKAHLETQWETGMTWENFGKRDGWQIDHIIPRCKFNLNKIEEFKRCHALSNLRPLWTRVNSSRFRKS